MRWPHFVVRKLGYSIITLLGLSVLVFLVSRVLPGDPARLALGPFAAEEQVQRLRETMGMDRPLHEQYWSWLTGVLRGDFGMSFQTRRNVALDIAHYLPATVELVLVAILWIVFLGIPLGLLAGRYKDSWIDNAVRGLSFVGVAVPPFVVGLLLQLLFGYLLGILPVSGRMSFAVMAPPTRTGLLLVDSIIAGNYSAFSSAFLHILLPSFAVSLTGLGQIARLTRAGIADVATKDYIEATRAFGIPERTVLYKYMLKPSFVAPLTILGLTFASELANAFLVEMVFSWPGLASYGIRAILRKDFNAVMGVILIIGVAFLVVNLIVDLITAYIDPRTRAQEEGR